MKKINEEENEDFFEQDYFSFQRPNLGENQTFWNKFWLSWCISLVSKNRFSENFSKGFFISKTFCQKSIKKLWIITLIQSLLIDFWVCPGPLSYFNILPCIFQARRPAERIPSPYAAQRTKPSRLSSSYVTNYVTNHVMDHTNGAYTTDDVFEGVVQNGFARDEYLSA